MGSVRTWFNEMYVDKLNSLENCNLASIESKFNVIKGMLQTAFDIEVIDSEQFDYLLSELKRVKSERVRFFYEQEKEEALKRFGEDKEAAEDYCYSYFKALNMESDYAEMIAEDKAKAEGNRVNLVANLVVEVEKCNEFILEKYSGVFNRSDRFYETLDKIWNAFECKLITKKLAYELEAMLLVP